MMVMSGITIAYLLLSAIQDLKERKIYSFPANVLAVCWFVMAVSQMQCDWYFRLLQVATWLALYFLFRLFRIWGEGDSDLFLVFAGVCLAVVGASWSIRSLCIQVLLFAGVLITAMAVALIEAVIRRRKLSLKSSIAVAPGFLIVITAVLMKEVFLC